MSEQAFEHGDAAREQAKLEISGVFSGHVADAQSVSEVHAEASTEVDKAHGAVKKVYRSFIIPGYKVESVYAGESAAVLERDARTLAQLAAAEAYRMAPVTPLPKPTRPEVPMKQCPTCEGRAAFFGEACPECNGMGRVPIQD